MGEGYWVWLIPLSSGPISIGVCADPRVHPFDTFNEPERMREWLRRNEPQLAAAIDERVQDMEDFLRVADFAYGVERILSPQRWALVGEAGAFADPFFSPGSDFIAMSNTFACDVLTRELDGEDVGERVDYFNSYYQRAFEFTIAKYEDHYFTFGNPWVMNVKLGWEMVNLQVPPLIIINGLLDDLDFLKSVADDLEGFYRLNLRMQQLFHDWRDLERREVGAAFGVGGPMKPLGVVLTCLVQQFDEDTLRTIITNDLRMVEGMAVQIFHKAASALPSPPDPARPVDPYAVSLAPERWDADGLYDGERGLTLEQARELAPGVENLYLDAALAPS